MIYVIDHNYVHHWCSFVLIFLLIFYVKAVATVLTVSWYTLYNVHRASDLEYKSATLEKEKSLYEDIVLNFR